MINHKGEELSNDPIPKDIIEKYVVWCQEIGIEYGLLVKTKLLFQNEQSWLIRL